MFQRRQSLRFLFGNGRQKGTQPSVMSHKKSTRKKKSQTKLESVNEGRLGMAPRLNSLNDVSASNMSHLKFLTNPPPLLKQFMWKGVDNEAFATAAGSDSVSSSTLTAHPRSVKEEMSLLSASGGSCAIPSRLSFMGRSAVTRNTAVRRRERFQKSFIKTKNIQFSSPEEARVFELYTRQKSKKKALTKKRIEKKDRSSYVWSLDTIVTDRASDGNISVRVPRDQPPRRMASVPLITDRKQHASTANGVQSVLPEPPASLDWNKTPVTSNKGIAFFDSKNAEISKPVVANKLPCVK